MFSQRSDHLEDLNGIEDDGSGRSPLRYPPQKEGALPGARRAEAEPAEGGGITILLGGLKGREALAEEFAQRIHSAGDPRGVSRDRILRAIMELMMAKDADILATRVEELHFASVRDLSPRLRYDPASRTMTPWPKRPPSLRRFLEARYRGSSMSEWQDFAGSWRG